MHKQIKVQLIEMLQTFQQVLNTAGQLVIQGNEQQAEEILGQLQGAVIEVGTTLEQESVSDTRQMVSGLEQVCELLWQTVQGGTAGQKLQLLTEARQLLVNTEQLLQKYPVKRVIAFFPYKASMWECMESIWRTATVDEEVETYVVPIPYFDLKNGQVTERHYEGGNFPKYVPITDYRNFPLEQYQPDVAFIHNPFDRNNLVTSVLPEYYSDRLKQWVNKLVYVPYFMSLDSVYITHRFLPSYLNCDYIVTQNEKMAESFDPVIPKEKFLSLGSPIADRAIYLDRHRPEIPQEWMDMLPEGKSFENCRKILLNTSISQLLQQGERFLDKIEAVFHQTRQMDRLLLIWRPHPLLKISAKMQSEQLASRLEQLEKEFLQKKLGILDHTADVGIAVALCDAYLGENSSSVLHMFGVTGKPRFYLNAVLPKTEDYEAAREEDYRLEATAEGRTYLFLDTCGYLAEYLPENGAVHLLAAVPEYAGEEKPTYGRLECCGEELVLIADGTEGTLHYDLKKGIFWKVYGQEVLSGKVKEELPRKHVLLPKQEAAQISKEKLLRKSVDHTWAENAEISLTDYLYFLQEASPDEWRGLPATYMYWLKNMDGTAGEKIYQAVKKSLEMSDTV